MAKLAIKDIIVDPTVQIRRGNHEPTIRRYMEAFEKLPPVIVFKTPEGLLLADGFHRIAAADRLGERHLEAIIRKGTREDALEFAVINNAKNADPLTPEERDEGIRRLKQLHPDWSLRQIAEAISVGKTTVESVFKIDAVKRAVVSPRGQLSTTHYREVAAAPKEQWEPLLQAADKRGWSSDETALARQNLKDPRVPKERKQAILAGKADPVAVTPEGQFAVPSKSVSRRLAEITANDAILAFERALEHLAKARLFKVDAILEPTTGDILDRWVKGLPGDIAFLEGILDGAKKARGRLRVVAGRKSDGAAGTDRD